MKPKNYQEVKAWNLFYVKENTKNLHPALRNRRIISHRNDAVEFIKRYFSDMPVEECIVLGLGNRNNVIGFTTFKGETNQCAVYPRSVFRFLLTSGSASFIIAHNHPGTTKNPSEPDWILTNVLFKIGKALDLPMMDHIIYNDSDEVTCMKELPRWPGGAHEY